MIICMHHAHKKLLKEFATELKLSDDETMIYMTVIEHHRVTILQLAKVTGINRVTVHNGIKKLIKKGLVHEEVFLKKRYVLPAWVDTVRHCVEEKKKSFEQLEHSFLKVESLLSQIETSWIQMPDVKVYDGATWMRAMLERTRKEKETMYGISDNRKFTNYLTTHEIRKAYEARAQYGNATYLLVSEDFDDIRWPEYERFNVHLKTLPVGTVVGGSINIWWSSVYFHVLQWEHSATIQIESSVIAQMMMVLWKSLWNR